MLLLPCVPPPRVARSRADSSPPSRLRRSCQLHSTVAAAALLPLVLFGRITAAQAKDTEAGAVRNLITKPIDEAQRTVLAGNRFPLARAESDRGAAPAGLPMRRMLLVLKRSDEQESALRTFLAGQQMKGSANYHRWLTPEQFGKQFGPSDNDIEKVTAWLNASGFQVTGAAKGRTAIEFSGTAGQVQEAFKTSIHSYEVRGEQHWANASEPSIPSALTPVVKGVLTLHNFPRHSNAVIHGQPVKAGQGAKKGTPASYFTFASGENTYYGLGPTDFATIYDVLPLWQAGIDGTGQTIAVAGATNINTSDVDAFRSLFGLPPNTPKVILNGPDPGIQGERNRGAARCFVVRRGSEERNHRTSGFGKHGDRARCGSVGALYRRQRSCSGIERELRHMRAGTGNRRERVLQRAVATGRCGRHHGVGIRRRLRIGSVRRLQLAE